MNPIPQIKAVGPRSEPGDASGVIAGFPGQDAPQAPPPLVAGADDGRMRDAALSLLQINAGMRKAQTVAELGYFVANEARAVLRAQQIAVFEHGFKGKLRINAVSSIGTIDRASPVILWLEDAIARLDREHGLAKPQEFEAGAFSGAYEATQKAYPLRQMLWVPWLDHDGSVIGGMLLARTAPWVAADIGLAAYLAEAFAHAWKAVSHPAMPRLLSGLFTRRAALIAAAASAALLLFPVSMSALAPVEVAARDPGIVTSGVEGIVKEVRVDPNSAVKAGQVLLTLADVVLKNRLEIATREVVVAETKYKKAAQQAFSDVRGRHEMAIAKSELDLKFAERDYARELLERAEIKAERDGVAIFSDKKDLIGKPVAAGEKLMEIATGGSAQFHADLPVADAIVLHPGARVKVFLDSDPLRPVEAKLVRASYKAALRETQQLAFRVVAEADPSVMEKLRLGGRGTAQIYSDTVPLGFYLFRRPIAAARQWTGL